MEAQTQLSASTTVYLFAEQFAEPAKGLLAQGAIAPRTGEKVGVKTLVTTLYLAALMELIESGAARLETVEVKKLFGKEKVLALMVSPNLPGGLSALANQLAAAVKSAAKVEQQRVSEVIIRVVGGRGSSSYPWLVALSPVIVEAGGAGWVLLPEKKPGLMKAMFNPVESLTGASAVTARVDPLQGAVAPLKARLAAFEQALGPTAAVLRKEIENAIKACERQSD